MNTPISLAEFRCMDPDQMPHNEGVLYDVVQCFAEIEFSDPRLMIIIAAARIESALLTTFRVYLPEFKPPSKFRTLVNSSRDNGLIDLDFASYLTALRRLRNFVAHNRSDGKSLKAKGRWSLVTQMHDLTECVPVWGSVVPPTTDIRKSVFAFSLAGVLAAELDRFDRDGLLITKGFNTVVQFVQSRLPDTGSQQ